MKPAIKVYLTDEENNKIFGDGPYHLLSGVSRTGSLRASAMEMGMAYSKANKILKHAENNLGCTLTERQTGGKSGGGSQLTQEGKELLRKYELYRKRCEQANKDIYKEIFCKEPG